jgi:hypothetical protein
MAARFREVRMLWRASLLLLSAGVLASPAFAAGEPPAALVMSLSGTTNPPVTAMAELPTGAPLQLAPGAELTFLHYAKCKLITVAGGTLNVTPTDFTTDGKVVSENSGPCPRIHQLHANAAGRVAGGLVARGVEPTPSWPLNPELILVGQGTDKIRAATITAAEQPDAPLRLDVAAHRARFPANAPPLAPNKRYVLRLILSNRPDAVDIQFIGAPRNGPSLLVVLREE